MDTNTKTKLKKVLNYTKNIVLSLIILFTGLFLFPVISVLLFLKIADPVVLSAIAMLAPVPVDSWSTQLAMTFFTIAPSVAFIVWVVRDSRKFNALGIQTRPYLWGVGMVFPLIFIFFPFYFIRRNIIWLKEKQEIILASKHKKGLADLWSRADFVNENTKTKINKVGNILKWIGVVLVGSFGLLMIARIPHFMEVKKTDEQVAKIHATKLTIDDVMGKNLPPDPGAEADKTIAGIDANTNGIRDDVELAIFKEYPNSIKTRAVLLQYALALQMEVVQPFENERNVTEVVREQSRAYDCVSKSLSSIEDYNTYIKEGDKLYAFVAERQRNTPVRKKARETFIQKVGSYSESNNQVCDIDFSKLSD